MQYLTQTSELTLTQLKQLAKTWNVQPTGDKRRKQTWVDAIDAKRLEIAQEEVEQPQTTEQAAGLWIPASKPDAGVQVILTDYSDLYGTEQWQLLMKLAVDDACQNINFYRDFYSRAVELELIESDPGFDGGIVVADGKLTDSLRKLSQKSNEHIDKLNAQMNRTVQEFQRKMLELGIDPNTGEPLR